MLQIALALAAQHFPVFPCDPARPGDESSGKNPIGYLAPNGFKDATTDAAKIQAWWAAEPHANVGIAVPPGYSVIDVDPRNGGSLEALAPLGLPPTYTVRTGSGGWHLWFRMPEGTKLPGKLPRHIYGEGLDTRNGGGGYVIAPGCHHWTGGRYAVETPTAIAEAPPSLTALAYKPTDDAAFFAELDAGERRINDERIDALVAQLAPYYVKGRRHDMAKNLGGWLKQRGWSPEDVGALLLRLPSENPTMRVKAALAAFSIAKPFGWTELQGMLGAHAAMSLETWAPNPRQELEDRHAAIVQAVVDRGLPPALAPPPMTAATRGGLMERLQIAATAPPPVPTCFDALNVPMRGGLRLGKLTVIGGAPKAGKTSLIRQIADGLCRHPGVAVGWLAIDEEPAGIDARRLQAIGIHRDRAERPDAETLARAAGELMPLAFEVFDSGEGWDVENVAAEMARLYPNHFRVLAVDSLQTARTSRTARISLKAEIIDDVLNTLKLIARHPSTACHVIASSELNRTAYANAKLAEDLNDLAAFKGSGGVEYYAHTLLILQSIEGGVAVGMPKNRTGDCASFYLEQNRQTSDFHPLHQDPRESNRQAKLDTLADSLEAQLRQVAYPGISLAEVKRQNAVKPDVLKAALAKLVEEKRVICAIGMRGKPVWRHVDCRPLSEGGY